MNEFKTTRWSLVKHAAGDAQTLRRDALEELLTSYLPALRAHLVRSKRLPLELADELLQGFVVKNILEGELFDRADQTAGRLRAWMLKWLNNYVKSELNRKHRELAVEDLGGLSDDLSGDAFDVEWAMTTLDQAVQLMRAECRSQGADARWIVFERRLLRPLLEGVQPVEYEVLQTQLKIDSVAKIQNHLVTAKRQFQRALEAAVGRYTDTPDEIVAELTALRQVLAENGARFRELAVVQANSLPDDCSVLTARPEVAAQLFDCDHGHIWRRCLASSVVELLGETAEVDGEMTVLELLQSPIASEQTLRQLKEFGNSLVERKEPGLPAEIGLAIYLVSIAAANVQLKKWISRAPKEALQPGFEFLRASGWLDDACLRLIAATIESF